MKNTKTNKTVQSANNKDIRSFFNNPVSRRVQELVTPYLDEIKEENYKLRERKIMDYKQKFDGSDSESENKSAKIINKKRKRKEVGNENESFDEEEGSEVSIMNKSFDSAELDNQEIEYVELRNLKSFNGIKTEAKRIISEAEYEIKRLEKEFFAHEERISHTKSNYPEFCIPIRADIRTFDFKALAEKQMNISNKLFDVIMMDPPWQLSSSQPTRGVAIAYDTLGDNIINDIPIPSLQKDGFIFIWTINAKYKITLDLMKSWGYKYIDEVVWVKQTVNGKIAKGHGYYLQHTKETCLIGVKGNPQFKKDVGFDVIFSKRRGQSQKPEEIYERIEELVPNGHYLEIFGRRNNLRNYWVTIGNEL